jgi:hypothetical protein
MKANTIVTSSPAAIHSSSPLPDPTARAGRSGEQRPTPDSVELPVDVLDRIVNDLFAVGLALHASATNDDEEQQNNAGAALDGLDSIIARIRESVLRSARPAPAQVSLAVASRVSSQLRTPDLVALSSLPSSELPCIDLLDAAHNAKRALIELQNSAGPEERP